MTDEQLRRLTEIARVAAELARSVERTIHCAERRRTERVELPERYRGIVCVERKKDR